MKRTTRGATEKLDYKNESERLLQDTNINERMNAVPLVLEDLDVEKEVVDGL